MRRLLQADELVHTHQGDVAASPTLDDQRFTTLRDFVAVRLAVRAGVAVGGDACHDRQIVPDFVQEAQATKHLVYYPPVCDPRFWWCVPGGYGPGTVVRAEESTTEFGWNVGLGVTYSLSGGSELFFEAKYQKIETDRVSTEYIPLNIGIRW